MLLQVSASLKVLGAAAFLLAAGLALQAGPAAKTGGELFKQECSMCHGLEGKGYAALQTPDFTDPKVQSSLTDKEITNTIKNGRKGTIMPAFASKLSDGQIRSLVPYLRSLKRK